MKLRNLWLIARRDYLAYVARKRFWVGLLITPAILLAFIFIPVLIQQFESADKYAVIDHSGWVMTGIQQEVAADDYQRLLNLAAASARAGRANQLPAPLAALAKPAAQLTAEARKSLATALASGGPAPDGAAAQAIWKQRKAFTAWYHGLSTEEARAINGGLAIAQYRLANGDFTADELRKKIVDGALFAYFVIPAKPLEPDASVIYASKNLTNTELRTWFSNHLNSVVRARKVNTVGLPPERAAWLQAQVPFKGKLVTEAGAKQATAAEKFGQWLPIGYVYLLFIAIMSIAQLLMMSTIEEKSSRIAETLLSSVKPSEVMGGKTLGAALVGLTMVCFWIAIVLGLVTAFGPMLPIGGFAHALLSNITAWSIAWFLVYFLLGFLLYASVLGAIGAAVNNIQEAQPYLSPVMIFMILPLLVMVPVIKDPTATWVRVLSYFPPLTPFLMVNRSAASPPLVDYIATTALLIVIVAIVLYASGKIFRVGLLNTGAPPKLKELLSWMRTPKPE
ncbi:MAG: ABC transporter permease [Gammaproteobacteria bacterium]|nr:ABC transporter permease [Gammaproteobacteria bacterium]